MKVSRACAAVAGNGVTPAMRRYSTRAFSGSRFTRPSSGSIWIPNSRTRATPESSGAGLVQSGVKPPILACSAARTASLPAGSSSGWLPASPGPSTITGWPRDSASRPHHTSPVPCGLMAGRLLPRSRLPGLNRTATSPGATSSCGPIGHVAAVFPARGVVKGDGDAGDLTVVAGGLLGDPQQPRWPQRCAERPARGVVAAGQRVEVLAQRELHLGADGSRVARRPGHLDLQPGRAVPGLADEQFLAQQPRVGQRGADLGEQPRIGLGCRHEIRLVPVGVAARRGRHDVDGYGSGNQSARIAGMVADRGVRPRHGHAGGLLRDRLMVGGGDRPAHLVQRRPGPDAGLRDRLRVRAVRRGHRVRRRRGDRGVCAAPVGGRCRRCRRRRRPGST